MYEKAGRAVVSIMQAKEASPERLQSAARAYTAAGNHNTAMLFLDHAILLCPYSGSFYTDKALLAGELVERCKLWLIAGLVREPVDVWSELVEMAKNHVNVQQSSVLCRFIAGTVLWVEQRKNVKLRDEPYNELVKRRLDQGSVELLSLFFVYLRMVKKVDYCFEHSHLLFGSAKVLYNLVFNNHEQNESPNANSTVNVVIYTIISAKQEQPWTIIDADSLLRNYMKIIRLINTGRMKLLVTIELLRELDERKRRPECKKQVMDAMLYMDSLASGPSPPIMFQSIERHYTSEYGMRCWLSGHEALFKAIIYYGLQSLNGVDNMYFDIWTDDLDVLRMAAEFGIYRSRLIFLPGA